MRISAFSIRLVSAAVLAFTVSTLSLAAQSAPPNPAVPAERIPATAVAANSDFVIGIEDVLYVFFRESKDISGDVVVRPDGKISLPILNEIQAAGSTPEQLRVNLTKAAAKFFTEEPTVSVTVKQINSRKVFLVGTGVAKPGDYPLLGPMTVLQLLAKAGGLLDFADRNHILVIRAEKGPDGVPLAVEVSFDEIMSRKNLKQNVELKPGDTVVVR